MSEEGKILSAKKNGVGTLTFSNPERLNAMSREMTRAAAEVMEDFTTDPGVRVVIVTGAGKKAFISGGDISKFEKARATPEQLVEYNKDSARFRVALRGVGKPTIAMIRGWCLGGGLAVALNCDMRICTEDSQFGVGKNFRALVASLRDEVDSLGHPSLDPFHRFPDQRRIGHRAGGGGDLGSADRSRHVFLADEHAPVVEAERDRLGQVGDPRLVVEWNAAGQRHPGYGPVHRTGVHVEPAEPAGQLAGSRTLPCPCGAIEGDDHVVGVAAGAQSAGSGAPAYSRSIKSHP